MAWRELDLCRMGRAAWFLLSLLLALGVGKHGGRKRGPLAFPIVPDFAHVSSGLLCLDFLSRDVVGRSVERRRENRQRHHHGQPFRGAVQNLTLRRGGMSF